MKTCTRCKRSDVEFHSWWSSKLGRVRESTRCVECERERARKYQQAKRARLADEYAANIAAQQVRYERQRSVVR